MGPIGHVVVSAGVGVGVWAATGSPLAIPVALAAGVLPDLDHLIDFFDSEDHGRQRHMLRPFHAWELALMLLFVAVAFYSGDLFLAAVLGYLGHLAIDQLANRVHPLGYFITFRAMKGFRRRHLTPHIYDPAYMAARKAMPLWGKLEPSIWRLVSRLRSDQS